MHYLTVLLSLAVIFLLSFIVSNNRREIRYFPLLKMLIIQIVLGYLLLNTTGGAFVIGSFSDAFAKLLDYAHQGVQFVFGGLAAKGDFIFFFNVCLPIIVVSALIGILQYISVLQWLMRLIGWLISKTNGMGKLESYNGIASLVLGQSEVYLSMKKQLHYLSANRLYTLSASAISTVSMSTVGSYMQLLEPRFVVTALLLNLFGGFMVASVVNPYRVDPKDDLLEIANPREQNFFDMLGEYLMDGFKIAIVIAITMIGYVALIAMVNDIFSSIFGMTFEHLMGYVCAPFAFMMGVPWADAVQAGSLMAVKILSNEFVAMLQMQHLHDLDPRTTAIITVFLVSFANFSSIGVIAGTIKALSERQGIAVARAGLKLLYGATLVSLLSGTVTALLV